MNLDHDFVQVWKFREDQKKNANRTLFFPKFRWRPLKKKVFSKNRTLFLPDFRWRPKKKRSSAREEHFFPKFMLSCTPFQIIGGMQKWTILKLLGDISPPSLPGFRHHWLNLYSLPASIFFIVTTLSKKTTTLFCCKQCRRQSNRSEGALAKSEGVLAESEGVLKSTELLHIKTDILPLQILTILLSWLKNRRIRPAVFLSLFRIRPI